MSLGAAIGAARAMDRLFREMDRDFSRLGRSRVPPIGPPLSFARYRDPSGRFEIGFPSSWESAGEGGFLVSSPSLGAFARIDVLPRGIDPWGALAKEIVGEGGLFLVRRRVKDRAHGEMGLEGARFGWDGRVLPGGGGQVALCVARVLDSGRSRAIELYEHRLLAAIGRSFRVPAA